ncbi:MULTISPECIES: transporter substrate-binding domain-containing protein [unclassified Achromobacter]|uniref:transporter substrate-binding domain-containing protein n=1 Tax=unclassified Achromobacter TaxID=2626865 RepID=UPI00069D9184|nr:MULTISPECIES: transporter substrate-binding domain-containing protein [unclassified Achromobacter]KOF54453.1 ABC transporter substrate-binding protein [Achromobacter sp. DMS1]KOF54572.1 ABC transporter substrate-binding protein [Achromobacter sp. DMS1]KOF55388.1 ABC transporter substrate-binding protein [Achromobacter sp. DMS1]
MKPSLAVIALSLSAAAAASAQARDLKEIEASKKLVCGTQSASEPYAFQDPATRRFVGYDVDVCQALAKGLGVELVHKPLSTEARIPELKMGRVDVVAGSMAYLPERAAQVDYSLQYLQGSIKVLVRRDEKIGSLAQLEGKRVCASKGSSSAAIASRVLAKSKIVTYQDLATCYLGLQNGKVDGISAGELTLKRFEIESAKTGSPAVLVDEPLFTERMGVVVSKGNTGLMQAVDKVLAKMDADGELDAIYAKWLGKDSIYKLTRSFKVEPVAKAN